MVGKAEVVLTKNTFLKNVTKQHILTIKIAACFYLIMNAAKRKHLKIVFSALCRST